MLLIWDHIIDLSQYYNSKDFQYLQRKMKGVKQTQNASSLDCSRCAPCYLPPATQETNQNTGSNFPWTWANLIILRLHLTITMTLTENPEVQPPQLESLHSALLPECLGSGTSKSHLWLCETQLWCSWSKYWFILWETSASLPHTPSPSHAVGMLSRTPFVQRRVVIKLRDHILIIWLLLWDLFF